MEGKDFSNHPQKLRAKIYRCESTKPASLITHSRREILVPGLEWKGTFRYHDSLPKPKSKRRTFYISCYVIIITIKSGCERSVVYTFSIQLESLRWIVTESQMFTFLGNFFPVLSLSLIESKSLTLPGVQHIRQSLGYGVRNSSN